MRNVSCRQKFTYYVNDGVFGSFNLVFFKIYLIPKTLEVSVNMYLAKSKQHP